MRFKSVVPCTILIVAILVIRGFAEDQVNSQKPQIAPSQVARQAAETPQAEIIKDDGGPAANWIWGDKQAADSDRYFFRKTFEHNATTARLTATCDNVMTVFINGQRAASSSSWESPVRIDVSKYLNDGENEIIVDAQNQGGVAGMALKLSLADADGNKQYLVSDDSWQAAKQRDGEFAAVAVIGKMGVAPWRDVFSSANAALVGGTPRGVFSVLPGFQVELLYDVPKETQGSWVSIAFDDKGRLIASDQGNKGLFRVTPPAIGSEEETKVEKLTAEITASQGMLHAFGNLYVSVNGGPGSGFYRLRDTDGDDQYDEVQLLKRLQGGGEHGPHAVRLGPDGKSLYLIAGNHTNPPEAFDSSAIPSNWDEDLLLPRQWDARGHARGKLAPGGWIARTDADGSKWEMFSIGYRNPYDMDFNADGELFAYDADMEWDLGSPWYRPTRVVHATSGSEFGWRSGTGKWRPYYVDSLPPMIDIGPGSPVGVTFGYGAKFPAKYQKALYILDWTFGTMYAVHIEPSGASYTAVKEEFIARTPLPLTDAAVGPDGALYFTIGGRGTNSALFRVTYVGDESTKPANLKNEKFAELRDLRHELESMHTETAPDAVEKIWSNLSHQDRHIRYAARVALEFQDTENWKDRALNETDPEALITSMVALARQGDKSLQERMLNQLNSSLKFTELSENQQLELLRTYALIFARMGHPGQAVAVRVLSQLDEHFPSQSEDVNAELCRVLCYLNSPTVITNTLDLMAKEASISETDMAELLARNARYGNTIAKMLANQPELQNIHYAYCLRTIRYGWTLEQRMRYFEWFNEALDRSGGASYEGFINNIRNEAMDNLSPGVKLALESKVVARPPKATELPKPVGPGHKWTASEIIELTESGLRGCNFENGKRTFAAARCVVCHRFDGNGGATGPDLSNVAGRFNSRDLTDALVEPNKVISDQYRASVIQTIDGRVITGRIVNDADGKLTVMTDPEDASKTAVVSKSEIDEVLPSKTSLMPSGLLDVLSPQEVRDLLAYMLSRGNPNDIMFSTE